MKVGRLLIVFVLIGALTACIQTRHSVSDQPLEPEETAEAEAPVSPEEQPFVADFVEFLSFGYWSGEPFASVWTETRKIPFQVNRYFGWRIKLKQPHKKYLRICERFTLPAPPANWGGLERRHLVTADRCTATVPNTLKVRDHWVHRANWSISAGDSMGRHVLEVYVEGKMAARIIFQLEEDETPGDAVEEEDELPDDQEVPEDLPHDAEQQAEPPAEN